MVLWSSCRTTTRQLSPSPEPGPPVRGSSIVSVIGASGYPPRLREIPIQPQVELVERRGLEDRVGGRARRLVGPRRIGLHEAVEVPLRGKIRLFAQGLADAVEL